MGTAAAYYLSRRRGAVVAADIARVYKAALAEAFAYSKSHPITPAAGAETTR
jgi:hypothetical protein